MPRAPYSTGLPQSGVTGLPARFPLIGPSVRAFFAVVALLLGLFTAFPVLELLEIRSADPATDHVVGLTFGTLFFGLPALVSAVVAIRPPKTDVVVDAKGVRVENPRRQYGVEWHQVRAVAISITWPNPFGAPTPPRRRFRRRTHILFALADPATELPPQLLPWGHHREFSHAVQLQTSPLEGDEPPIVRGLARAMSAAAPGKFAGVLKGER